MLAAAYIDVFRAIPLLVLLIVIYYALPFVGIRLSPFAAAATALSLVSCRLHGRDLPGRHRGHPGGPVRGRRGHSGCHWWLT